MGIALKPLAAMEWVPADRVIATQDSRRASAFLRSSELVRARYLRCRSAWEPHLRKTRCAIERGIQRCPHHRTALIFGGGMLHDVPIETLAHCFERVVLVDVVHLWRSVLAAKKFPNVTQVCVDLSGFIPAVEGDGPSVGMPGGLMALGPADLVVSLNLMSQLAVVPRLEAGSKGDSETLDALGQRMVANHLASLNRVGGEVTLITDIERWEIFPDGRQRSVGDLLFGVNPGPFDEEWVWTIGPIPEVSTEYHVAHRVGVRHWTASQGMRSLGAGDFDV